MEELPKEVDFVVCGTGLPCSIFAAACARIGKSVLQIDRNAFYGSEWSNFNLKEAKKWKKSCHSSKSISNLKFTPECFDSLDIFPRTEQYRFNINVDNTPLFSSGKITELLIQSKATRYLSFKNVASLKTVYEDEFMSVPASRADLFASKRVSVIEKRKMMNFLSKALQEEPSEDVKTFDQFLDRFKLTEKLKSFVKSSIIFSNDDLTVSDGLAKLRKFVTSLGKYSAASAFLYASYGSGELAQAFARMCAVFGGITVLEYPLEEMSVQDNKVTYLKIAVPETEELHQVQCGHMIAEPSNYLDKYHKNTNEDFHQVVIILADEDLKKIIKDEKLALAEDSGPEPDHCIIITAIVDDHHIWGLALDSSSSTTPIEKSIVTLRCRNKPILDKFSSKFTKNALLQMEFSNIKIELNDLPENVHVSPSVQFDPDYDYAVSWAESLFKKLCPGEEWLPPMPEPGDIIFPSDSTENKAKEDSLKASQESTNTTDTQTKET